MAGDLTLRIDLGSPVPAYRQIADGLRALLVAKQFEAGEQLPTVRQLAMDLGVHHNTVAEAYRTLAEQGWLDLKRRRGATVLARSAPKASQEVEETFMRRLKELVAEAQAAGVHVAKVRSALVALAQRVSATPR